MRELVAQGYVGDVLSCHLSLVRGGSQERHSTRTWQRDNELGAHTLTIACGHSIDALRYVVGDFSHVSGVVSTQTREWYETDTDKHLPVTSPDNILVSGRLMDGGVASVHVASNPWAGSGLHMEIYGTEGTLAAISVDSPQLREMELKGVQGPGALQPLEVPGRLVNVLGKHAQGRGLQLWAKCTTSSGRPSAPVKTASPTSPRRSTCTTWWTLYDRLRTKGGKLRWGRVLSTNGHKYSPMSCLLHRPFVVIPAHPWIITRQ